MCKMIKHHSKRWKWICLLSLSPVATFSVHLHNLTDVHFYSGHRNHNGKKLVIIMGEDRIIRRPHIIWINNVVDGRMKRWKVAIKDLFWWVSMPLLRREVGSGGHNSIKIASMPFSLFFVIFFFCSFSIEFRSTLSIFPPASVVCLSALLCAHWRVIMRPIFIAFNQPQVTSAMK